MDAPLLLMLGGLPGTGKTTVATELLSLVPNLAYVRIDSIEQALRVSGEMGTDGVQASGYLVGCAVATDLLASGTSVLVECVNPLELTRSWWRQAAQVAGASVLEVELHCSDTREHQRRVESRTSDIDGLVLPAWQDVLERQFQDWADAHLHIDTATATAQEAAALISETTQPLLRPQTEHQCRHGRRQPGQRGPWEGWCMDETNKPSASNASANRLSPRQDAPQFTVETPGGPVSLAQLLKEADKGVVVYFYPKAGTPGCTTQACDFRDNLNSLKSAGYTVIGISPDSVSALERFQEKQGLNFPLGSDPDHKIMTPWGTWGEKKNYGRTYVGVIRSTFVVDKDGKIARALYNVKATGHVARLRKELGLD